MELKLPPFHSRPQSPIRLVDVPACNSGGPSTAFLLGFHVYVTNHGRPRKKACELIRPLSKLTQKVHLVKLYEHKINCTVAEVMSLKLSLNLAMSCE